MPAARSWLSAAGLDRDPHRRVQAADQLGRRAQLQDLAAVHDRHPVAEDLRLVHVVGGQHDRLAAVVDRPQHVPQVAPGLRVQRRGRLVEEHHSGSCTSAQAMDSRCACPPDSFSARVRRLVGQRRPARASRRPATPGRRRARRRSPAVRGRSAARRTTCPAAAPRSGCSRAVLRGHTGSPSTVIEPVSGSRRPSIISTRVVLPAPFGPRMPKNSPSPTDSETPSTAVTDP